MQSALIRKVDVKSLIQKGVLQELPGTHEIRLALETTKMKAEYNRFFQVGDDWFYVTLDAHTAKSIALWAMQPEIVTELTGDEFYDVLEALVQDESINKVSIILEDDGFDITIDGRDWQIHVVDKEELLDRAVGINTHTSETNHFISVQKSGQIFLRHSSDDATSAIGETLSQVGYVDAGTPVIEHHIPEMKQEVHPLSHLDMVVKFLSEQKDEFPDDMKEILTPEFFKEFESVATSYRGKQRYKQ